MLWISCTTATCGMGSAKWLGVFLLLCFIQVSYQGDVANDALTDESYSRLERGSELVNQDGRGIHERALLEARSNATRLLAVKERWDPLDSFQKYRGGFDVTSQHYWASAVFTGIYGFAIGAAWLLLGVLVTLGACCKSCCCDHDRVVERRSAAYYWIPCIVALLLSLIVFGIIVTMYIRNGEFHTQAFKVRDSIAASADNVIGDVRNVTDTLTTVDTITAKYNIQGLNNGALASTRNQLTVQSDKIYKVVNDNMRNLNKIINAIRTALIILLAVALFVVVVAGLLSAIVGWSTVFFLIILVGWLIAALTWILFGVFYAANNVTSDTCQAFSEYLVEPANTTLAELIPCVDEATAARTSNVVRQGIKNIVARANDNLNGLRRAGAAVQPPAPVPALCDPIGPAPDLAYPTICSNGAVTLAELPSTLANFVCDVEPVTTTCLSQRRFMTPSNDTSIKDLSQAGQRLEVLIPTIDAFLDCSVVYNTFETMVRDVCPPTIDSIRNLWIPLLLLSTTLTFLSLVWIFANHRNKNEHYATRPDLTYSKPTS